jgi:hypothetical protein
MPIRVGIDQDVLIEVECTDIPEGLESIAKRFHIIVL